MLKAAPLRVWAMVLAALPLTASAGVLTLIVWNGGWDKALEGKQLNFLGWTLLVNWALIGVIVVKLADAKLKISGPAGTGAEINSNNLAPDSVDAVDQRYRETEHYEAGPASSYPPVPPGYRGI